MLLKSFFIVSMIFSPPGTDELELGERLTLASCGVCHLSDDGKLSGKQLIDVPKSLGKIYSSNITNDAENGIGNWSREDITRLLREGTRKDGKQANIMMPRYKRMSDADLN